MPAPAQPSAQVMELQVPGAPPAAPPGYPGWGQMPPPMPAPKKDNTALIIVVVVVVVVALVLSVPILLYVMVSGVSTNPNTNNPSSVLQAQNWNAGSLIVNVQSSTGAVVDPTDLTYIIQDRNGTTFYSGIAGLNLFTMGTNVNLTFQDNIGPNRVGAGDSVRTTVTPSTSTAIQGGRLRLFTLGNEIGAVALP